MPTECSINNPYLNSLVYEAASVYSNNPPAANVASGLLENLPSEEQRSLYLKPFHAAQVIEPLLSDVKPSLWTTVCKDDELMRDLLSVLLRCEYQFTGAFHKDLLLEDMASRRTDFCSPLLVNVLLAYACVCYPQFSNRVKYWDPTSLMYRFIAEAKRLWELEVTVARITTIQAGILFCVFHNLCGLDEIGQTYRLKTVSLAYQLQIFDCIVKGQSERLQRGREFTAWAVYNWETLSASTLMQPPLIKKHPRWTLPNPSEDPSWYGEVWVRYPLNHGLSPCYIGEVLRAKSQFRVITNEFCEAAYSKNSKMDVSLAYHFYEKLEQWCDSLPGPLTPKRIVLPGQFHIHMSYHHLLLTIFEPLSDAMAVEKPSPQQIVGSSKRNLQTLIRLYYLRHGFEATDLFIVIPLMVIGYDATNTIKEGISEKEIETLRSTLILIAYGLYYQRRSHYLAQALFRVIRGKMRPQEISLLRSSMALEKGGVDLEPEMSVAVRSRWPVSGVVKKHEDVKSHMLSNLVDSLENGNVEESS
ncbi:NirA-like nitrate assimilation regulatory protein [Fusarium heterosporum]|uniref:NirA-like nitrate assimilation regulatory protein n=1 Tax=Fusarium heterosporum TaxID=42747 RepID=A0A8H5WTP8_FUSHE|nr:NirA-like nitrate assimilation regulatory protein [Fusarium heterosporum]